VGDYLFTDADFVQRLSTEHRGVFQKLFDEIKHLCKLATAGTKEARELEKVKKLFEDAYRTETKNPTADGGVKYSLVGRTVDGSGIYKTNYPPNTPKSVKQADLISLIQNVWSNEPITLKIVENGEYKDIVAKFNPKMESRSDLAKIAFGNRKGTAAEQRMTLDLASDLYQIATEARYNYSKEAIPKPDNPAHDGVTKYHYFLTNLVYKSYDGEYIPCHMNIDVKKNADGEWFYSFAIEKGSAPQTLLAAVTENSATLPTDRIDDSTPNVNKKFSLGGNDQTVVPAGEYRITGEDVALAPTKEDIAQMEQGIATAPAALRNDVDAEELGAPTREDILQMEMERELYGDWRMTDPLDIKVEKLYRLMLREQISEEDYYAQLAKADRQYQQRGSKYGAMAEDFLHFFTIHCYLLLPLKSTVVKSE